MIIPDPETPAAFGVAAAKLTLAFGTPLFGIFTSLISNIEAWLRISNLCVTLVVGICAFASWYRKRNRP